MSSIPAISQVEAKSKLHDHDAGWMLRLHGGELQQKARSLRRMVLKLPFVICFLMCLLEAV